MLNQATARQEDYNGWFEVKGNPLSKVGVFPYSGAQIGADDPDRIYMVYRPEEELAHPECINSFKLLPWIDEHTLLGSPEDGLIAPERKGVEGVIGEDVFYQEGYLRGNIKAFSDRMAKLIDGGKKELSCGYRCRYEMTAGIFDGQRYDAIQRDIRGNHLALVDEGRMGKEVAVLDHFTFTIDTMEAIMPNAKKTGADAAEEQQPLTLESLAAQVGQIMEFVNALKPKEEAEHGALPAVDEPKPAEEPAPPAEPTGDMCDTGDSAKQIKALQAQIDALKSAQTGMDRSLLTEISERDALVAQVSAHIGTFDHSKMLKQDVAVYATGKLGIKCVAGQEVAALQGFLHGRSPATPVLSAGDSNNVPSSQVDDYING